MDDKRFESSGEFYLYRRKDIWEIEKVVSKGDYNYAVVRGHPKATRFGYVLEHRVVMENYLGRLLRDDEVVHHIDGDKKNNAVENLQVLTHKEHNRLHSNDKPHKIVDLICPVCKSLFTIRRNRTHLSCKHKRATSCSRRCGFFMGKMENPITVVVREYTRPPYVI